jgi:pimeloyl-ACP methyl ester carboxylesterase
MIVKGTGSPIVLIPGIPGRWEWLTLAVDALAEKHRVITFSLGDPVDDSVTPDAGFDAWLSLIDALLDRAGESRAAIVGVSFGGVIAARYAARRPHRTSALVLVSAPTPRWRPDKRTEGYLRYPKVAMSALVARSILRLTREVVAAKPTWRTRIGFGLHYAGRAIRTPASPTRMAEWVRRWMATDVAADCAHIVAPTLLVTGESHLDRAVPVNSTLDYLELIPGSRHVTLSGTGHVGVVTKPHEFAKVVGEFVDSSALREAARLRKDAHAS